MVRCDSCPTGALNDARVCADTLPRLAPMTSRPERVRHGPQARLNSATGAPIPMSSSLVRARRRCLGPAALPQAGQRLRWCACCCRTLKRCAIELRATDWSGHPLLLRAPSATEQPRQPTALLGRRGAPDEVKRKDRHGNIFRHSCRVQTSRADLTVRLRDEIACQIHTLT